MMLVNFLIIAGYIQDDLVSQVCMLNFKVDFKIRQISLYKLNVNLPPLE